MQNIISNTIQELGRVLEELKKIDISILDARTAIKYGELSLEVAETIRNLVDKNLTLSQKLEVCADVPPQVQMPFAMLRASVAHCQMHKRVRK